MLKTPYFRDISSLEITLLISLSYIPCLAWLGMFLLKRNKKKYIFTGYSSGWNSRHFPFAVFSYEWCVLPQSVKSKMEALTPKSAIKYMVTALYIQVNLNDRQEKKWNHKHTNKNPRLWAMAFDHELVNIPIFISWEKDLLPPTWNSLMMLENPRCSSFIPW